MRKNQSGHAVLITITVVLALAILGILGFVLWKNFINKPSSTTAVTTFAQCKAAAGSKILETFPEQCVTSDGQTFTGPSNNTADETKLETYCTDAEKICFEYPKGWTIDKQTPQGNGEPGNKTDLLAINSPDKSLSLNFQSGIDGIGGTCDVDDHSIVTILDPTPIASLSGYADDSHVDVPYVLRAVVQNTEGKFYTILGASANSNTSKAGNVEPCAIGFATLVKGKNSILSSNYSGAGYMQLRAGDGGTYATRGDAIAAFDSNTYKEGASIIASLHYE